MENGQNFFLTQGDVLLLLVRKDSRKVPEIASLMGVHEKTLPDYYKRAILPEQAIESACKVFRVDRGMFDIGKLLMQVSRLSEESKLRDAQSDTRRMQIDALQKRLEASEAQIEGLKQEVRALREENLILQKPNPQ